jgi:RHS repeat-associated protein
MILMPTNRGSGKERDCESGLDNFEARYLGSSLGRFMCPDPMGGQQDGPQSLKPLRLRSEQSAQVDRSNWVEL